MPNVSELFFNYSLIVEASTFDLIRKRQLEDCCADVLKHVHAPVEPRLSGERSKTPSDSCQSLFGAGNRCYGTHGKVWSHIVRGG